MCWRKVMVTMCIKKIVSLGLISSADRGEQDSAERRDMEKG